MSNYRVINSLLSTSINDIKSVSKNIRDLVKYTPLEINERLSKRYRANIYIKREDLQIPRSFKIRGAYNKLLNVSKNIGDKQVICASAGNHAQGVALGCNQLNLPSTIYIPEKTPLQKINRIKHFGNDLCNIKLYGDNFNDCLEKAYGDCKISNDIFVHPFNDKDIIIGQATVAEEIYNEIRPDVIVSCIGGGGLISGISLYSKQMNKDCQIIGVEPETCPSMKLSILNNKIVNYRVTDNFVDGASVGKVGDVTYSITRRFVDKIISVETGKICENLLDLYTEDGIISEPAGALSISALDELDIRGKNVVCILSGGNNDVSRYPDITDRMLTYRGLKHYYLIEFAQRPGQLKTFINEILGPHDDIVRFEYIKKTNIDSGSVLIGVELEKSSSSILIEDKLTDNGFNYLKLNDNNTLYNYLI